MTLQISPSHNLEALAKTYARKKRGQVPNWLLPESADEIFNFLAEKTPWNLVYNKGEEVITVPNEKLAALQGPAMNNLLQEVYMRAGSEYQFMYYNYSILESYMSGKNKDFYLHRVLEFLNSEPVLDFVRKLTGIPDITKADAQATLYQQNCFLNRHSDQQSQEGRRCAYVLNLTREWYPFWGGYLQFFDDKSNIEEAYLPLFNTLNVFTVPKWHSVSFVPAFSGGARFSITGWFRNK